MYRLSQQQISMEIREKHLNRWKKRLRQQMSTPGISSTTYKMLKAMAEHLGEARDYGAKHEPKPGALNPGPMPQVPLKLFDNPTPAQLGGMLHTELIRYAQEMGVAGVQPTDSKTQVIQRILDHVPTNSGESP